MTIERSRDFVSLDRAPSNRRLDEASGWMHVKNNILTRAGVYGYFGREIMGADGIGLEPDRLYQVYRPEEELEKALPTLAGVPLIDVHPEEGEALSAETFDDFRDRIIGAAGTDIEQNGRDVTGSLTFYSGDAIGEVEGEGRRRLSCGSVYTPVMESGIAFGMPYEIKMTEIKFNHVALVERGRVPEARVNDSLPDSNREGKEKDMSVKAKAKSNDEEADPDKKDENQAPAKDEGAGGSEAGGADLGSPVQDSEDIDAKIAALEAQLAELRASKSQAPDGAAPPVAPAADEPPKPGNGEEGKGAAMDSQKVFEEVSRRLERKYQARDQAIDEVRPLVGEVRFSAMDSAESVYRYALKARSVQIPENVNLAGLKGMVSAVMAASRPALADFAAVAADSAPDGKSDQELKNMLAGIRVLG